MRKQDPLGYYSVLNVSPGASIQEIRLAYQFLKTAYHEHHKRLDIGRIRAAYETLSNPESRSRYDGGKVRGARNDLSALVRTNSTVVLLVLLAIVVAASLIVFGPSLKAGLTSFQKGDRLEWAGNGHEVGIIMDVRSKHTFPNGTEGKAYFIRTPDGTMTWYPSSDLERHARAE